MLVGSWFGYESPARGVAAAAGELRLPILGDAGAISLGATAGVDDLGNLDVVARANLWFALSPRWSVQLGAGYQVRDERDVVVTLGFGRLFGR